MLKWTDHLTGGSDAHKAARHRQLSRAASQLAQTTLRSAHRLIDSIKPSRSGEKINNEVIEAMTSGAVLGCKCSHEIRTHAAVSVKRGHEAQMTAERQKRSNFARPRSAAEHINSQEGEKQKLINEAQGRLPK